MKPIERYLEILGVQRGVSRDDLKAAYRAMIQISHPDRFHDNEALRKKAEEQTRILNEAYAHLLANFEQTGVSTTAEPIHFATKPQAENRTGRQRDAEEKKRQDAEYQRRKALREAREAQQAAHLEEQQRKEKQTLILGIVFVVLLFLYVAISRREAMSRMAPTIQNEAVEDIE